MDDVKALIVRGITARAKAEIIRDSVMGVFKARPAENKNGVISCYSDLYDYADANYYGGAFQTEITNALAVLLGYGTKQGEDPHDGFGHVLDTFYAPMQNEVDAWIKAGHFKEALLAVNEGRLDFRLVCVTAAGLPWVMSTAFLELLGAE